MRTMSHVWSIHRMTVAWGDAVYIIRGSYLTQWWHCTQEFQPECPYISLWAARDTPYSVMCVALTLFVVTSPIRCSCARPSVSGYRRCSTGKSSVASSCCSGSSERGWRGSSLSGWERQPCASRYGTGLFPRHCCGIFAYFILILSLSTVWPNLFNTFCFWRFSCNSR